MKISKKKMSKPFNLLQGISTKKLVYAHILIFIIVLGIVPPEKVIGIQRIITTFALMLLVSYWITGCLRKSYVISASVTLLLGLLDSRGVLSDYKYAFYKYVKKPTDYYKDKEGNHLWGNNGISSDTIETFKDEDEQEKSKAKEKGKDYSDDKTNEKDNTNFTDSELNDILEKDKDGVDKEDSLLKKAGGGLGQLHDLIEKAKKDSPYYDDKKSIGSYSPAQAQRATYHLVDTVKQLQDTMTQMMPLIKSGTNLLGLQKKITDVNTDDLLNILKK